MTRLLAWWLILRDLIELNDLCLYASYFIAFCRVNNFFRNLSNVWNENTTSTGLNGDFGLSSATRI